MHSANPPLSDVRSEVGRRRPVAHPRLTRWAFFPESSLGLIADALSNLICPAETPRWNLVTILIAIVGSILAGFLGSVTGLGAVKSFDLGVLLIATGGAIVLLVGCRLVVGRKRSWRQESPGGAAIAGGSAGGANAPSSSSGRLPEINT